MVTTDITAGDFEPRCATFLEHWKELRGSEFAPTVEEFLDNPSPAYAHHVYMTECQGESMVVRLEGTGLVQRWGRDLTGKELYSDKPSKFRQQVIGNFLRVIHHPCGCYMIRDYITAHGRYQKTSTIYLPLICKPGRVPRLVAYSCELEPLDSKDPFTDRVRTLSATWVDIGRGVPDVPPVLAQDHTPLFPRFGGRP